MKVYLRLYDTVAIKDSGELGVINSILPSGENEEKRYEVRTNIDELRVYKESELIPDMFEHIGCLPIEVITILEKHSEAESYEELNDLLKELGVVGYEFEYYLDAEPYMLREKDLVIIK